MFHCWISNLAGQRCVYVLWSLGRRRIGRVPFSLHTFCCCQGRGRDRNREGEKERDRWRAGNLCGFPSLPKAIESQSQSSERARNAAGVHLFAITPTNCLHVPTVVEEGGLQVKGRGYPPHTTPPSTVISIAGERVCECCAVGAS